MVLVHCVGGVKDGGGLGDGLDAFDPAVAVIAFVPLFFACEELCDGFHDRFLSVSISGLPSQGCWKEWIGVGPVEWADDLGLRSIMHNSGSNGRRICGEFAVLEGICREIG